MVLDGEPYLPDGVEDLQAKLVYEGSVMCHRVHQLCTMESLEIEGANDIAASAAVTRTSLLDVYGGEGAGVDLEDIGTEDIQ